MFSAVYFRGKPKDGSIFMKNVFKIELYITYTLRDKTEVGHECMKKHMRES